jgi:hypothetical protein
VIPRDFLAELIFDIQVRRHNGVCPYGPWCAAGDDAVPSWVRDLVVDEIAETARNSGQVKRGGLIWIYQQIPYR